MKSSLLLLPVLIVTANAATITNYTDIFSPTASIQYQLSVNGGGNQQNPQFLNGTDPTLLSRVTAVSASISDGAIVDDADVDLTFATSSLTWAREAATFTGVTSTWNPAFLAPHTLQYTINVSSSAGANSYVGNTSTSNLDLLLLVNFATLLDSSATSRQISVSWQDSIDFSAAAMPRNSLPTGGPYRWNLSSGLTGTTDLQLTLSSATPPPPPEVPEPSTSILLGSSLTLLASLRVWKKKK